MARITLEGTIATTPRLVTTNDGLSVISFRFAENVDSSGSINTALNWFTVVAYANLANQIESELTREDKVILSGELKVREWDNGARSGTAVEVEIDSIAPLN
jgi:single-strand DNA-binding protein